MKQIYKYIFNHDNGGVWVFNLNTEATEHARNCIKNGVAFTFARGIETVTGVYENIGVYDEVKDGTK